MLDADLAALYNVDTHVLVQAVKRNFRRFPADFMFQLSDVEWGALRSQIVTSKGRGGRRYAPYVFTEHGALMLSSVLNSDIAAEVGILVVRTFVQLRVMLSTHKELAAKFEVLEQKIGSHDQAIAGPLEATNRPYALAKIAGVEMCWSYNRQYGTQYLAVMPTNLYGPGDN